MCVLWTAILTLPLFDERCQQIIVLVVEFVHNCRHWFLLFTTSIPISIWRKKTDGFLRRGTTSYRCSYCFIQIYIKSKIMRIRWQRKIHKPNTRGQWGTSLTPVIKVWLGQVNRSLNQIHRTSVILTRKHFIYRGINSFLGQPNHEGGVGHTPYWNKQ